MSTKASYTTGTRFARRTEGAGWQARVDGLEGACRVLNVSRMGVALETARPMEEERRYTLTLTGPSGAAVVGFYVARCVPKEGTSPGRRKFEVAGLFSQLLERSDLPLDLP